MTTKVTQNGLDSSVFASQAEAEAGVVSTKAMTPERTKDFFDANFGNKIVETFVAVTDFDAGVDDRVTIAGSPGTDSNLTVYINGLYQETSTWSIIGSELVFTSTIPSTVTKIEISYRITVAIGSLPDQSVSYAKLASGLIADQATAEAGTADNKVMSPLKTKQAMDANLKIVSTTAQVLAGTSSYTFTHTLGRTPRVIQIWATCTTADDGYAIGDKIPLYGLEGQSGGYYGMTTFVENGNTTEIKVNTGAGPAIRHKDNGTNQILVWASWEFHLEIMG